ncbi:MAG: response regulator [Candidatus Thorarchaeota archaeon]
MATIFIVDDEVVLHKLYREVFALKGHVVIDDAYDGLEAIEKFKKMNPKPDVIVMDHRMPNKDGFAVMQEILKIDPNAKIVFVSADARAREPALKSGAKSFGLKPIPIRHMLELIDIAHGS